MTHTKSELTVCKGSLSLRPQFVITVMEALVASNILTTYNPILRNILTRLDYSSLVAFESTISESLQDSLNFTFKL